MKRSIAVALVLTFFVFGLTTRPRSVRAQIAPLPAAPSANTRASSATGATQSAAAPQNGTHSATSARSAASPKAAQAKSARSGKPHTKLPRMVFVVTPTRMEQPLDSVGTTVSVVGSQQIPEQQI